MAVGIWKCCQYQKHDDYCCFGHLKKFILDSFRRNITATILLNLKRSSRHKTQKNREEIMKYVNAARYILHNTLRAQL